MTILTEGYSLFHLYLCSVFYLAIVFFSKFWTMKSIFQLWRLVPGFPSLGWHHQTSALAGSAVDRLNNVDELLTGETAGGETRGSWSRHRNQPPFPLFPPKRHLLVIHGPVHLVVVSWAQKQKDWKTSDKGLEEWQGTILCIGNMVVCEIRQTQGINGEKPTLSNPQQVMASSWQWDFMAPVPKSIIMCLLRKKNITVTGS